MHIRGSAIDSQQRRAGIRVKETESMTDKDDRKPRKPVRDLGRAFGGALIFSLPMLMTMEFWVLGFTIDSLRLFIFLVVALPVLVKLSQIIGFEGSRRWTDNIADAAIALLVGALVAAIILSAFGVLTWEMPAREIVGKIAIQTVPAAIGALLARSQFGSDRGDEVEKKDETYSGEMFHMAVGALFLGLNVASTEEIAQIAYRISAWHAFSISLISIVIVHSFVFAVGFRGGSQLDPDTPWWREFLRFTLPGYLLGLAISLYLLWTFHSADELPFRVLVFSTIVLGLPSSIGAAAARLIL